MNPLTAIILGAAALILITWAIALLREDNDEPPGRDNVRSGNGTSHRDYANGDKR